MTGTALCLMALLGTGSGSAFDGLRRGYVLATGEEIRVVERDRRSIRGAFRGFEEDRLLIATGDGLRSIAEADVREIRVRRPDPVWNGALNGLLAGIPLVILNVVYAAGETAGADGVLVAAVLGGGMCAAIGAGVDALIVGERSVYRGPAVASTREWRLAPIATAGGGAGLALGFRF